MRDAVVSRMNLAEIHDLIANRVGVTNEVLGCRYQHAAGNPLVLEYQYGMAVVKVKGNDLCEYGQGDRLGALRAFVMVDAISRYVWLSNL